MVKWTFLFGVVASLNERLSTLRILRQAVVDKGVVGLSTRARSHLENTALHKFSYDRRHESKKNRAVLKLHARIPHQNATLAESMPLKASAKQPGALLCLVDHSFLLVYIGSQRLLRHDLGHEVVSWGVSASIDQHSLVMVDPKGGVHIYDIRVRVDKSKKVSPLSVSIVKALTLSVPIDASTPDAEECASGNLDDSDGTCFSTEPKTAPAAASLPAALTAPPLVIERKGKQVILLGDSYGRITFFEDGIRTGSLRVANEPIIRLVRNAGNANTQAIWLTAWSCGFVTLAQMDVPFPPCRGWADGAAVDVDVRDSRLVVSLNNSDMLVFSTVRGKVKTCELLSKYPRMGPATDMMKRLKGHYLRLASGHLSIINIVSSEQRTGEAISLVVPHFATAIAILEDRLVAVAAGSVEIYDMNVQSAPEFFDTPWFQFDYFPRIGIFGVVVVLAIVWNVKKVHERRKYEDDAIKDEITRAVPENFKDLEERINAMQKSVDRFQDEMNTLRGAVDDD